MRICFFGDSFTLGTGDDECLGWVGRVGSIFLKQGHDLTVYNMGVRRDTSGDILARWEFEATPRLPSAFPARLVFSFGSNDAAAGEVGGSSRLTLNQTISNARAILQAAQLAAPTFLVGPIPVFQERVHNARIRDMSQAFSDLCATLNIPFFDLTVLPDAFWSDWNYEAEAGDGVHPNSRGYEHLAKAVSDWAPLASSIVRL